MDFSSFFTFITIKYIRIVIRVQLFFFYNIYKIYDRRKKMNLLSMSYAGITPHEYAALTGGINKVDRRKLAEKLAYSNQLNEEYLRKNMKERNISVITIEDEDYPGILKETYDPPYILYCRGDLKILKNSLLGVVGSRKATSYSRMVLSDILPHFKNKISVISGLAYGADEMAHKISISSGVKTIGVLAFGFDFHYPATTKGLREIMEKQHLVISEYPPHSGIDKWKFIARNRIISGLSKGVLVTEAEERSGSLITLDMALNENRHAYCVPGNITSKLSKGTNLRVQEGAKPVLKADDILEDFSFEISSLNEKIKTIIVDKQF